MRSSRRYLRAVSGAAGNEAAQGRQPVRRPAAAACDRARARHQPKVLLLDEPTEGIQPSIIKDMAKALNEIRKLREITIVVSEQVLSFALDVADRLLVIEGGRDRARKPRAPSMPRSIRSILSV
jgi:ABC-type branched-subunit amino acid transport system ATPase component